MTNETWIDVPNGNIAGKHWKEIRYMRFVLSHDGMRKNIEVRLESTREGLGSSDMR